MRVYAGQTAEQRADARRRRFLDAGLELFGTRGISQTTVRAVCAQAGLSTRLFYETFDSLDDLAGATFDEIVEQTFAAVAAALAAAGPSREEMALASMTALFEQLTDDPRRARVVLIEPLTHPALSERRAENARRLTDTIVAIGQTVYDATDEPVMRVAATLVAGGVVELVIARTDGRLDMPREDLIESAAALVRGIGDTARDLAGR